MDGWTKVVLLHLLAFGAVVVTSHAPDCRLDLNDCLGFIASITQTKKIMLAINKDDLDVICRNLSLGLKCVDDYIETCLSRYQKNQLRELIGSSLELIGDLCTPGTFQENYLLHAECFQQSYLDTDACNESYEQVISMSVTSNQETITDKDAGLKQYCCSYMAYLHCATVKTRVVCGNATADFMENYLRRAVDPLVRGQCNMSTYNPDECSSSSCRSASILTSIVALLGLWANHAVLNNHGVMA